MYRLTITVVTSEKTDDPALFSTLADKLEEVADDLRHDPRCGSFGAYGAHGCDLYYRVHTDDEALEDDLLSVRPIMMMR